MALQQNETVSITLKIEGEKARNELAILEKESRSLEKALKEVPKGSAEWAELNKQINANTASQTKLRSEIGLTGLTYKQLQTEVKTLTREISKMTPGTDDFISKSKQLKEVEERMVAVGKGMKGVSGALDDPNKQGLWTKLSSGFNVAKVAMGAFLALEVVQTIIGWGKAVFEATSKFEGYEKSLAATFEATMSQDDAQRAAADSMAALSKIAKETPLSLDDVTKAYIGLAGRGLRPGEEQMKRMIDVSTKARLPLDQLGEAIKDINNNERWTEFGIKVKTSGDKISTTVKGVTTSFARTEQGALDMVVALGEVPGTLGFAGKQMDSLGGKSANVGDTLESLQVTVGKKLAPMFLFLLDVVAKGIDWFIKLLDSSDPVVQVFVDMYDSVEDLFSSVRNAVSSIIPDFIKGWISLDNVMKVVGLAFRLVLTPTQVFIGTLRLVYDSIAGVIEGAKGLYQVFTGDLVGAAQSFEKAKVNFTNVELHAKESFEKIKKGWTDAFVDQPKKESKNAELASYTAEEQKQIAIAEAKRVANEKAAAEAAKHAKAESAKRLKEKEQELESFHKAQDKYDKEVESDRGKALELIAQLESEHNATVSKNTLESEEAKINEVRRKRLKQINDSLADETTKETARAAINRNADDAIEKTKEEFRVKTLKADQELAVKRTENARFISEQERQAELAIYDFKELSAKGNATKLATIAKERLETELRYLKENLALEEAAEKAKITADYADKDQAAAAILAIEKRYHQESITADKQAAVDKKAIDDDLREKKQANIKAYSEAFTSLLKGDVAGFLEGASKIVQGHKTAWQERLSADLANYQTGAQVAQAAVDFLNDLAQKKAEKAIAAANKERDEKVAILNNEISVTESLITSSSNYVTALKQSETNRLSELQRILTSETTTEEEKRAATKKYYSEQLQQMKAAEEAKIQDLQRLANLAKTEDEKRAIEAKIELAKKESAEKIRLADEEAESKMQMLDELESFSVESSQTLLEDATKHSEKQILLASDEAEQKADFKADLEETIAAENRKARATEVAEKKKAFAAEKKAKVASALISGASAVLSALATPPIFVGIVMAAIAAGLTAVQIAKIKNQPEPTFAHGGFIAQGGKHGSSYGSGGIALIDRQSGREVGEMEGDEAIISADQTEANLPLIHEMFRNARTPSLRKVAVSPKKGMTAFRDGGMFESPYWQKEMYLFGSKKRKAQAAAAAAEAEAAAASASAGDMSGEVSFDAGNYSIPGEGSDGGASTAESAAAYAESQKMAEAQLTLLEKIDETIQIMADELSQALGQNGQTVVSALEKMGSEVSGLRGSIDGVRGAVQENVGATRGVEGAVREANANGVLYGILDRISNLK